MRTGSELEGATGPGVGPALGLTEHDHLETKVLWCER